MDDGDPQKPLAHVAVLDVFGHPPTSAGRITSVIAPLVPKIELVNEQLRCMVAADRARARPPILTETIEDGTKPAEEVQYDYYADAMSLERNGDNMYIRNQQAVDTLEAQRRAMGALQDDAAYDAMARGASDEKEVSIASKRALLSLTPLPTGQRVSVGPLCGAPDDIVDRIRFIEQEIFVTLGVPRSFCMHDMTVRHDAAMLHCTLTRTVHKWQACLSTALSYVYNLVHAKPAPKWTRKRKKVDISEWVHEELTTVRFEQMPRVKTADITFAYDKGVLSWEGYRRQLATLSGFEKSDLVPGTKDPWTRDERLASLLERSKVPDDDEEGAV